MLKIRVWDSISKEMHPWETVKKHPLQDFELDHYTIMLFTGKKDSRGNDLYEGDIIEFDEREWGGNDNIFLVTWDNDNAEWCWGGGGTSDMEWRTGVGR